MTDFVVHNVRFFDFKPKAIHRMCYNKEEQKLAVSREDASIEIWDVSVTPFQEKVIPGSSSGYVEALAWCGRRLFSTGFNGDLTEYDLHKLSPMKNYQVTTSACWCMKLSPSGQILAIGTEDGTICMYEITSDDINFLRFMDKQKSRILCLAWHPSDKQMASGSVDSIHIWNTKTGSVMNRISVGRSENNQGTIIWCIDFLSDYQIVSGDSAGKVSFWDGKYGTLIDSLKSHKADILTICTNSEENRVYASGVDPNVVVFERVQRHKNESNLKHWVKTLVRGPHTHDVHALALVGQYLTTGGMDTYLIFLKVAENIRSSHSPIPQNQLVTLLPEKKLLLLRYSHYLELWKLGMPERAHGLPNEVLPLTSNPSKLLCVKAKENEQIVSCALSNDAKWLAYSTISSFRLFHLDSRHNKNEMIPTSLKRIQCPALHHVRCHHLAFTPDSSKLILGKDDGTVQIVSVGENPEVIQTLHSPEPMDHVHLMIVDAKGDYIAIADYKDVVNVFSADTGEHVCRLPKQWSKITTMAFNPKTSELVVAYNDQQLLEFDVRKRHVTRWSKAFRDVRLASWQRRRQPILGLAFHPHNEDCLMAYDDSRLTVLVKSEIIQLAEKQATSRNISKQVTYKGNSLKKSSPTKSVVHETKALGFHYCHKYKHLTYFGIANDGSAVAVEVNQLKLIENLPDMIQKKKFGT